MTPHEYILYRRNTLQLAMAGIGALVMCFVCLTVALGAHANDLIRDKAVAVIETLSEFTVFHRPDVWDRGPSPAYTVLMDAVRANKDLVNDKVRQCIGQLSKREALEVLKSGTIQINPTKAA